MTVTLVASTDSDAALMKRVQAGDHAATVLLWECYSPKVCRFMQVRLHGSGDAAEDLAADVMERTLLHPARWIDTGTPLAVWLYTVARNRLYDHLSKSSTRLPSRSLNDLSISEEQWLQDGSAVRAMQGVLVHDELTRLLVGAGLTAAQRTVISLRWLHDASIADTARRTGMTEESIVQLQARAFKRLRRFSANAITDGPTTKMHVGRGRTRPPQQTETEKD